MRRRLKTVPTSLLLTGAFWPAVAHATDDTPQKPEPGSPDDESVAEAGQTSGRAARLKRGGEVRNDS